MAADLIDPSAFMNAMFVGPDVLIEVRLIEDRKGGAVVERQWYPDTVALVADLCRLREVAEKRNAAIYFGVLPRRAKGAGKAQDTLPSRVIWADFDFKDFPDGEEGARRALAMLPIPPSCIVRSGHGLHAYWLLREPSSPEDLSAVAKRIAKVLGADHAFDAARILRLPGTFNRKDPANPIPVTIEFLDGDRRYNLSEITDALDLLGEPEPRAQPKPPPGPAVDEFMRAGMSPHVTTLVTTVKKVKDAFWGIGKPETDGRGKKLDNSSSGYDFSLGIRLAQHGVLDPVELATALSKRPDGEAAKKGSAYIRKTVQRVLDLVAREDEGGVADAASQMDFVVTKVVIYTSNPPSYAFTIDGQELRLDSGDLLSPAAFIQRFLEGLHRIPMLPNSDDHPWAEVVNGWLQRAERVEQPPEASREGALREAVEHVLRNLVPGEGESDLERGHKLSLDAERMGFRLNALFAVVREEIPEAKRQHVSRILRELGFVPESRRVEGETLRLWCGPEYAREGGGA